MAKKLTAAVLGLAALAVAAFWYWSPYWSLYQMRAAARGQDAATFNTYVDYPRLRDSLKEQFASLANDAATGQPASSGPAGADAAFGKLLGMALVDRLIDELVRPETVMRAMQHGRIKSRKQLEEELARARQTAQDDITTITLALRLYKLDHGAYPTQKQGLGVLVKKSAPREDGTREPYLDKLPNDPWGRPYRYRNPGADGGQVEVVHDDPPPEAMAGPASESRFALERAGVNQVLVRAAGADGAPNLRAPSLVFVREGFAGWKLVAFRLPPRTLDQ